MKKIISILACAGICASLLSGCSNDNEPTNESLKNTTTASIGSKVKPVTSPKLVNTKVPHTIKFNGHKLSFVAVYGIQKRYVHNWKFCSNEMVNLSIKPTVKLPADISVGVNNVYADISVSSSVAKYNGVRQDSVNISYSSMPDGMVSMDKSNPYSLPFQVESINQNESSFYIINDYYVSESTHRISESQMRDNSDGARLNAVWTIAIKDNKSNQTYFKTINDAIGIPYK